MLRHALAPGLALWVAVGCSPAPVPAPEPVPAATETPVAGQLVADAIRARHEMFRGFIEEAARRMPADRYDFRPVPEIMRKLTIHLRLDGVVPPSSAAADLP